MAEHAADPGQAVRTWISPKAAKGAPSAIAGRGLFATEAISRDEVVAVKGGHIVATQALLALPERLQNSDVQIADNLHLAALSDAEYEAVMIFINHSCEPNVGFVGNIVLVAMRDIAAGEELTTDYSRIATAATSPGTWNGRSRPPGDGRGSPESPSPGTTTERALRAGLGRCAVATVLTRPNPRITACPGLCWVNPGQGRQPCGMRH